MNSMTGFGRAAAQADRYNILVEISGVNRKQTEIAVNVPRGYAEWDASVRSIVQGAVSRGRVGVSISVERLEEADGSLQLDEQKLASLAELLNRASDLTGQPLPLQASDLLRLDIVTSAAEASLSPCFLPAKAEQHSRQLQRSNQGNLLLIPAFSRENYPFFPPSQAFSAS